MYRCLQYNLRLGLGLTCKTKATISTLMATITKLVVTLMNAGIMTRNTVRFTGRDHGKIHGRGPR